MVRMSGCSPARACLKGFDFAGNEIWGREIQKEYGRFGLNWGYASSPVLYEDSVYVQVIHGMKTQESSYILRIDKRTGKTLWRIERHTPAIRESHDSYSTPVIAKTNEGVQLIVLGGDVVTGHDLKTGEEIWRVTGFNPQNNDDYRTIASATYFDGIVFAPTRERPLQAFKVGGKGDITSTNMLWKFDKGPRRSYSCHRREIFLFGQRSRHRFLPRRKNRAGVSTAASA